MDHELFVCNCGSVEHMLVVSKLPYNPEYPEDRELYLQVHLATDVWYRRLINAVRYVFGRKSRYGDFDEIILEPRDQKRLIDIISAYMKTYENR